MRKIKIGSPVMVKDTYKYKSTVSLHRVHTVQDVKGAEVLLKGYSEYLPLDMFELYK